MKTAAVMQPYLFPYIGYMNLVYEINEFIFYDDVQFIKQGWINRNQIIVNGQKKFFTFPTVKAQQSDLIKNVDCVSVDFYFAKFRKTVRQSYASAPNLSVGLGYIDSVFAGDCVRISELASRSVKLFFQLVGIDRNFHLSSDLGLCSSYESRTARLAELVESVGCGRYVNPVGGADLYAHEDFTRRGLELAFIAPRISPYTQSHRGDFIGSLSIIDLIMNCDLDFLKNQLSSYDLR